MTWAAITGFRLVTRDIARLRPFYEAIGFRPGDPSPIPADELRLLGVDGGGTRLPMTLGDSHVDLDQFDNGGAAYPTCATAAALVFQHLALVTDDADAAWSRATAAGAISISRAGPVTLPASSGGVTAVKFRDPDGHPLEFLQFPADADSAWHGSGVLGIDHSAISVGALGASRRFFAGHGLTVGDPSLNQGPSQVALDGLDGVVVDVVPMKPPTGTPHVELLGYRTPRGRLHDPLRVNDVAASRIVWRAGRDALVRDPDGHLHQLTR